MRLNNRSDLERLLEELDEPEFPDVLTFDVLA
jgi:hypothetical protein